MSTDRPAVLMELSLARTALDDPAGLPPAKIRMSNGEVFNPEYDNDLTLYAIDRIDGVMRLLDTDERPVSALRTICALITDIGGPESPDDGDPQNLIAVMQGAVSSLSWVADVLEERGHE